MALQSAVLSCGPLRLMLAPGDGGARQSAPGSTPGDADGGWVLQGGSVAWLCGEFDDGCVEGADVYRRRGAIDAQPLLCGSSGFWLTRVAVLSIAGIRRWWCPGGGTLGSTPSDAIGGSPFALRSC